MQPDARQQALLAMMRYQAHGGMGVPQEQQNDIYQNDLAASEGIDRGALNESQRKRAMLQRMHDEYLRAKNQRHYNEMVERYNQRNPKSLEEVVSGHPQGKYIGYDGKPYAPNLTPLAMGLATAVESQPGGMLYDAGAYGRGRRVSDFYHR